MQPGLSASFQRRYDLDWLRIAALGLLIVTHVTYAYRSVWWRVHSDHAGLWGDLLVEAMAPWRISIVFFVAGAATRFMLDRHDFPGFVTNRILRLLIPFVMAVVVLVPPMVYIAEPQLRGANYLDFLGGAGLHGREVYGLWVPDWSHVWFLPYVFFYGLLTGILFLLRPQAKALLDRVAGSAPVFLSVLVLALFLVVSDAMLKPAFGRTNMFVDDPAGHVRSLPAFVLGLMLARPSAFWPRLRKAVRWLARLAGLSFIAVMALTVVQTTSPATPFINQWVGLADGAYGAVMVFLILALASRYFNRSGPGLSYFGDAIMPVYLLHQPIIVFAGEALLHSGLPLWAEFGLILGLSAGLPLVVYHFVIRQTPFLRVLFGLKLSVPHAIVAPVLPLPSLRS